MSWGDIVKKIKIIALLLLVLFAIDHMCYIFFSFPSIYHYATLHPTFEKWYALVHGFSAIISLLYLEKEDT